MPNKFVILVLNNSGGQIFEVIDGPDKLRNGITYITTPHKYSVRQIAEMHQIKYVQINTISEAKSMDINQHQRVIIELMDRSPESSNDFNSFYGLN